MNAFLMFPSGGIPLEMMEAKEYDVEVNVPSSGKLSVQLNGVDTFIIISQSTYAGYAQDKDVYTGSYIYVYVVSNGFFCFGFKGILYRYPRYAGDPSGYDPNTTDLSIIPSDSEDVVFNESFLFTAPKATGSSSSEREGTQTKVYKIS